MSISAYIRQSLFLIATLLMLSVSANPADTTAHPTESVAAHEGETAGHKEGHGGAEQDPVEVIMHHVADANENHIATIGDTTHQVHITMPLPCILINKETKKVSVFMSSAFHHAPDGVVDGYKMEHSRVVDAVTGTRDTFYDISITKNVFNMLLGFVILTVLFMSLKGAYEKRKGQAPKGLQSFMEPVIQYIADDVVRPVLGPKTDAFLPYLISVFFFILINNLLGLIPFIGGINSSGNISFTMVLAFCSFLLINLNGNKHYWQHIFAMPGVPKWVLVILTPIELLGVFLKPAVLMLRLFGNITGGHIAVLSIVSLIFIMGDMGKNLGGATAGGVIAIPILLFVNAMELFVAFLQAYVFTLLSTIFIGAAVEEHHHAEHH